MTEVEQLREEINKLRERVAVLEARPAAQPQSVIDWERTMPIPSDYRPSTLPSFVKEGSFGSSRIAPHAAAPMVPGDSGIIPLKG